MPLTISMSHSIHFRWILIGIFIVSAHFSYAQSDSLRNLLKNRSTRDSTYVLMLCEYAYSFDNKNYDSVLHIALRAYHYARALNFEKGVAFSLWLKGMAFYYLDDVDSAQRNLDQALPYAIQSNALKEQGRIYNTLANVARYRGNHPKSLDYYFKSLRIKEGIGDVLGAAITLNNIANVYSEEDDWARALPYYRKSLFLRRSINRESSAIMLLSTLSENHLLLGHRDSSRYYLNRALYFSKLSGDPWAFVHVYYSLTNYYIAANKLDSALSATGGGLIAARGVKSRDREALFLIKKSELFNLLNRYSRALVVADSALSIANELKRIEYVTQSYKNKSRALAGLNRFKEAYSNLLQFKILNDCTQTIAFQQSLQVRELEYSLETEKLKAERERESFQQQEKETRILLLMVVFVAVGISGLAFMFYRNIKFRTRVNQELERKQIVIESQNKEIQTQNEELQLQQEEISATNDKLEEDVIKRTHELHETVLQLTAQNQGLEQFSYITSHNLRAPLARIAGIVNLLKMSRENPTESSHLINLLEQTTSKFEEVIQDLALIVSLRKGVDFSRDSISVQSLLDSIIAFLEPELTKANARVSIQLEANLIVNAIKPFVHSIFLNLIQNAVKYRSSSRQLELMITGTIQADMVYFAVADNGIGIDLNENNTRKIFGLYNRFHPSIEGKGFGLYLVKTQIELMGGGISVESKINVGSTFKFYFPSRLEETKEADSKQNRLLR